MKRLLALSLASLAAASQTEAIVINLSTSPVPGATRDIQTSDGTPVADGSLVRIGTFDAGFDFAQGGIADYETAFHEFGTAVTDTITVGPFSRSGLLPGTVEDASAAADFFSGKQIYLWIWDAATADDASEWGVFTSINITYTFPVNVGGTIDSTTVDLADVTAALVPGTVIGAAGESLRLTSTVPEPATSALFLGGACVAAVAAARRRRDQQA